MMITRPALAIVSGLMLLAAAACGSTAAGPSSPPSSSRPASPSASSPKPSPAASAKPAASAGPASASPAASAAANPAAPALRLAAGVSTPASMFVYLAADRGIFAKNGLNVNLQTMSGLAQMQAVVAGDADATLHVGADLVFTTEAQGSDLKIVFTGEKVDDDLFLASNDITSIEQLKGKKIGAQTATSGNGQIARRLLAKYGLQEGKDYTVVLTGSGGSTAGVIAALVSRQVDAVAVPPAIARPALKQGKVHVLTDIATRTDLPIGSEVLVFPTKYVQQHPDTVQKTVDSLIESVRLIHQDKAAAQAELKSRFKVSEQADLDEEWDRQVLVLSKEPLPRKEDFADIIAAMPKDVKPLTDAQLNTMLDPTFVNNAISRGLTKY